MAERLGEVLYWLGCALAALTVVLAFVMANSTPSMPNGLFLFLLGFAAVEWLVGRALLYVLAGR